MRARLVSPYHRPVGSRSDDGTFAMSLSVFTGCSTPASTASLIRPISTVKTMSAGLFFPSFCRRVIIPLGANTTLVLIPVWWVKAFSIGLMRNGCR